MKQPLLRVRNESGVRIVTGRPLLHLVRIPAFQANSLLAQSLGLQNKHRREARAALKAGEISKAQALIAAWKRERTVWRTLLYIRSMRALQDECPAMDYRPTALRMAGLDWRGEVSEQGLIL